MTRTIDPRPMDPPHTVRIAGYRAAYWSHGAVWVWDDVAGHYVRSHDLTPAHERYVKGRTARYQQ